MVTNKLIKYCKLLSVITVVALLISIISSVYLMRNNNSPEASKNNPLAQEKMLSHVDEYLADEYEDNTEGQLAAYGEELIKNTFNYFYKNGQKTGNHLACSNCHLQAGTKAFAAPYIGLHGVFPVYIGRENKIESLEERINGCFERSLNGEAILENGKEMRAIVTYIKKISKGTKTGTRLEGQGFVALKIPDRRADLQHGTTIFEKHCRTCHGEHGEGQKIADNKGYLYPPLWGSDSYNDGAGMSRVLTAARFIKANMPLGATYASPVLTDEEAYDVAAYINSFDRPEKANKEKDYPNLAKKPKDCAYPPYMDSISQDQHKYGPFNF